MRSLASFGPRSARGLVRKLLPVLVGALALAAPTISVAQLPGVSVTVCQVTGTVSAPSYAQVTLSVDQVAAFLNQYPGSFVGTCPASPPPPTGGGGTPVNAAVTICQVTGNVTTPFTEVNVAVDQVAAYLNQHPGSFVGSCPAAGGGTGGGGTTGGLPSGSVTICRVSGSASAPSLAEVSVAVDQVAAFLNENPGSFVGSCPASGGGGTGGGGGDGTGGGALPSAGVAICRVTGSASAPSFAQVAVAADQVAAFLNTNRGSFVGTCPSAADPNGTPGPAPLGYVTICHVTGNAATPYATLTLTVDQLAAYLRSAGDIIPAPAAGCPTALPGGGGGGGGGAGGGGGGGGGGGPDGAAAGTPSTATVGRTATIVVETTPNTVVTATGAGVRSATKSDERGRAVVKVKPKRPGIITVRGAGGRVMKRIGVAGARRSSGHLTG